MIRLALMVAGVALIDGQDVVAAVAQVSLAVSLGALLLSSVLAPAPGATFDCSIVPSFDRSR